MTCRHDRNDPLCSKNGYVHDPQATYGATYPLVGYEAPQATTPDASNYEVLEARPVNGHLLLRVKYPNCARCAYEGAKVLVFLDTRMEDAMRWRRIDPHFREADPLRVPTDAPAPSARFPASDEGWHDAITYAGQKMPGRKR